MKKVRLRIEDPDNVIQRTYINECGEQCMDIGELELPPRIPKFTYEVIKTD